MKALQCLYGLVPDTLSAQDSYGYTPAHGAADKSHVDALRCLHELVPETLSAQDNDGQTPAHAAATNDHMDMLRCLHELVPDTRSVHRTTTVRRPHTLLQPMIM